MELNIKTEGLDDFMKKIGELTIRKTLNQSIRNAIIFTERQAKKNTPRDTGQMYGAYEEEFSDLYGELSNKVKYAPYVHFGHRQEVGRFVPAIGRRLKQSFVKGNPWMYRTLQENQNEIEDIFNKDIEKMLNSLVD